MNWYKVWMVVPGTDGDAENGPCELQWWNDMVQADDEPSAVATANAKARVDWGTTDGEYPCGRELGEECPVCTGVQMVTDEEYAAWVKQMEDFEPLPFE